MLGGQERHSLPRVFPELGDRERLEAINNMPTSQKLATFFVTVLDIAGEKMQGVLIHTLSLNLTERAEKLGCLVLPTGTCQVPSLTATVNRSFVNGMT